MYMYDKLTYQGFQCIFLTRLQVKLEELYDVNTKYKGKTGTQFIII